ncbi:MAG: SoxR reducing system RseC family protein [candidate division WOR-3 bacterium]
MADDSDFQETGRVLKVEGDRAEVAVVPTGGCEHCGAAGICNWTGKRERVVLARNLAGARSGELVVLRRRQGESLGSALLIFGLPAILMVTGVVLGSLLGSEWLAVIFAGAGLLAGGGILILLDRHRRAKLPVIVSRIAESKQGGQDDESNAIIHNNNGIDHGCRSE